MRYLPRPIGQRMCTELQDSVYSLTRPLIAATEPETLRVSPEKMDGRSPTEDMPRPLPFTT